MISPSDIADKFSLSTRVEENLADRIRQASDYDQKEIKRVSSYNHRVLPEDFTLEFETGEKLRALAAFSQCELKPAREISSHRKIIGPIIVWLKRLTWPFVKVHLDQTFRAQQEFNSLMVECLADQISKSQQD